MIVKVAKRQPGSKSSFSRLATYITDAPQKGEKVLAQWCSNVANDDVALAVREIKLTQSLNQATGSDKSYHLIVSFPTGERPDLDVLKDIEDRLVSSIGLSDHQRICVVHDDTSHFHFHIAINKICPVTAKLVTPFRDYKTLNDVARSLEQEYGLTVLGQEKDGPGKVLSDRAQDVESHKKVASFQRWAKDTLSGPVKDLLGRDSVSWGDVHSTLAEHGLMLKKRGVGFIITTGDSKFFVKPSTISREFTRPKLEARLGEFIESTCTLNKCSYAPVPASSSKEAVGLYADYKKYSKQRLAERKDAFTAYRVYKDDTLSLISRHYKEQHRLISISPIIHKRKKAQNRKELSATRLTELGLLRAKLAGQRRSIMDDTRVLSWVEYLIQRAEKGDAAAIEALRNRDIQYKPSGNHITGIGGLNNRVDTVISPTVHKNGDVSYGTEDGERVVVSGRAVHVYGQSDQTIKTALDMAKRQFGFNLIFNGNETFIGNVEKFSQKHDLDLDVGNNQFER